MQNHELKIEITRDGKVHVEVRGVKGKGCLKYVEFLQQMIGRLDSQELTSEYYEPDTQVEVAPLIRRKEKR